MKQRLITDPKEGKSLYKLKAFQTISPKIDSYQTLKLSADISPTSPIALIPTTTKKVRKIVKLKDNQR